MHGKAVTDRYKMIFSKSETSRLPRFCVSDAALASESKIANHSFETMRSSVPIPSSAQVNSSRRKVAFSAKALPQQRHLSESNRPQNIIDHFFNFFQDRSFLSESKSPLLGPADRPSLFQPKQADGGLLRSTLPPYSETPDPSPDQTDHPSAIDPESPKSSWKNWKKITVDIYFRLAQPATHSRVRLKQTIALLPILKIKPVIDLVYRPEAPMSMHLDIKLLDAIKYRFHSDGYSFLEIRARAPLSDPRFMMDVVYQRDLQTASDSVKLSFRALGVAFLKAPNPGFGVKIPVSFDNGIKTTVRVKQFLVQDSQDTVGHGTRHRNERAKVVSRNQVSRYGNSSNKNQSQMAAIRRKRIGNAPPPRLRLEGPIGIDVKIRCLEYR